jgi:muramoyltetrapeptide carboxypeptidase
LHFGDLVGIVAPSSPPADPGAVTKAAAAFAKLGFKTRLSRHARKRLGFLAGSDAERAADLMEMFLDPEIKGIVCLRGGYGAGRLLRLLDYVQIRRHPKVFVGFSDITALHCALVTQAGMVCFHGPTAIGTAAEGGLPEFTRRSLLRNIMEPAPSGSICAGYIGKTIRNIHPGRATGPLVGGNLSLLCVTLGTPFQPGFRGAILFFEDVGEEPYRIDRMLTHLLNAGLLEQVAGIAVGINANCQSKARKKRHQTVDEVLDERLSTLGVPVLTGLPFGHVPPNATIPLGLTATLDTARRALIIDSSAVL